MSFLTENAHSTGGARIRAGAQALLPLFIAALLLVPLALNNLSDPNFWFDESGQFWMAKGLNHFSSPLSGEGTLYQVMQSNQKYNLDPGGFTLLLHYWLQGGSAPWWLRILPFTFLVLTLYFLIMTAAELTGSLLSAVAVGSVGLLPFDMVLSYGFELRPYSMEVAGVVAAFYFLVRAVKRPTQGNLWLLGLVCGFFLTSRYSFVIAVAAVCPVLLLVVFRRPWRFIAKGYGFYGPVAAMAVAVWLLSLSHQDPGGSTPFYVRGFILQGKDLPQIIELVKANFLAVRDLPYLIFVALVPLLGFTRLDRLTGIRREYLWAAWLFLAGFQAVSIILAAFGKYPWHINTRWNLNLQALVMIADVMLLALVAGFLRQRRWTGWPARWGKLAVVICLLALTVLATDKKVRFSNDVLYSYVLSLGDARVANSQIFVGYYASPSIRYLFEYGPLKDRRDIYPRHFFFESREEYQRQVPLDADRFDVALLALVDDAGVQKYLNRFGNRFVLAQGQPLSYLLVKSP